MRDDYEHSVPGLIGWLIIFFAGLFLGTKSLWFNELHPADKALFWTNLGVAAGTMALAVVTFLQVRETKSVLLDEDLRHQQNLAPIVKLDVNYDSECFKDINVANIGLGPALDVEVRGEGIYRIVKYEPVAADIFNPKIVSDTEQEIKPVIKCSAIGAGRIEPGKHYAWERSKLKSMKFIITYTDVFGNRYETSYEDFKRFEYLYKPSTSIFRKRSTQVA